MTDLQKAAIITEISLMLAAVFWCANYAATKYAAEFMPLLLIVALRFTAGGILMFCLLQRVRLAREPQRAASYPSALQSCSLAHSSKVCHLTSGCSLRNASMSAL